MGFRLYFLLTGSAPWTAAHAGDKYYLQNREQETVMNNLDSLPTLDKTLTLGDASNPPTPMSFEVRDLVSKLLSAVDPATRPSLDEIRAHPWMAGQGP